MDLRLVRTVELHAVGGQPEIVGDLEADVKSGKISISSPIARALIGKSKGETAEVTTPKGARSYEVLKVEWK